MGLFSTAIHIYKRNQEKTLIELAKVLQTAKGFSKFSRVPIDNLNYEKVISTEVYTKPGVFYLITKEHGPWITLLELNVNVAEPFYLSDLVNALSRRLDTYALLLQLHDDDVVFYNLEKKGKSLDGYNSNYQYFLAEAADKDEIISQRHSPIAFLEILPPLKKIETLNAILNEGYWSAFDNNDLDEDGIPNDDKYNVNEEGRLIRLGKELEIYRKDAYPFSDWKSNLLMLNLPECYLLRAQL